MFRKITQSLLILLLFLVWVNSARAGFGVSPPHIINHQLTPGSEYKEEIRLLRSSADEDLKAQVKINAPEIEDWISIDKDSEFVLPKGELQVPMMVTIAPPKDTELGNYEGHINVRVVPADSSQRKAGVSIALGARIDMDLALTNVTYADFLVRTVSVPDIEKLGKPWSFKAWSWMFEKFFYKTKAVMNIENTGNVRTAPTKVTFDVFDITKTKKLESHEDKTLKKVKPFSMDKVEAEFPTKLDVGQYWAEIRVYKGQKIVNYYQISFAVEEPGSLGGSLGIWPWLILTFIFLLIGTVVILLIKGKFWRVFSIVAIILIKPFVFLLSKVWKGASDKFWGWIIEKAERYKKEQK